MAKVNQQTVETVEAVRVLMKDNPNGVNLNQLVELLNIDKSNVSRRIKKARLLYLITELESNLGRPSRLIVGPLSISDYKLSAADMPDRVYARQSIYNELQKEK